MKPCLEKEKKSYLIVSANFALLPTPSLQRGSLLSEPAIQVRRKGKGKQIWSLEKLENRLLDMRDLYQEWKECEEDSPVSHSRVANLLV